MLSHIMRFVKEFRSRSINLLLQDIIEDVLDSATRIEVKTILDKIEVIILTQIQRGLDL